MASTIPAIGIDLGTTYCCVAVYHNGKVQIIPNQEDSGDYTTPSYVFIDPDGDEVVGKQAKQNAFRNPENTIYDVKRILGRRFTDAELQKDMKYWPFTVQEDDSVPKVKVNGKLLYPEQISAKLLAKLRNSADDFLSLPQGTIKKAVITVPAYFNDGQRQATVDAGELAGLEVLTILNEPTAAAIAYSVERMDGRKKKVLVFDLGGGTFDVAVLNMEQSKIDVLGVNGDTHLGGEDFDKNMMEYCASRFKLATGLDLLEGKDSANIKIREETRRNLRRLQTYCENAKQYLTAGMKTKVTVDAILNGEDLIVDITRDKFEELNKSLFLKTINLVDATLKELKLSKSNIDDVVLVGGSTRIPKIQDLLKNYFGGKILNKSIHPDQAVAYGAAVKAAMMTGEKSIGQVELSQIQDVTPMSIGIEVMSKALFVIIPKNAKIPVKNEHEFCTGNDDQVAATIQIYQGENIETASSNKLLGLFDLKGIPPKKANEEVVDVSMEINDMGILHVEAVCRSTKGRSSLTVLENKNRMSQELKKKLAVKNKF